MLFLVFYKKHLGLDIRICIILKFVKEIQDKIDLGDMAEIVDVIEEYNNEKFLDKIIKVYILISKNMLINIKIYMNISKFIRILDI